MKYNGTLNIAEGRYVNSRIWKNKTVTWSHLSNRLLKEHKTNETFEEFMSATKKEKGKIKDVGGYVGGYLRNGRRKPRNVLYRQLITLDLDYAHLDFWDDFTMQFDNAAVLHSTHSHSPESPRYRLVMPLDREVSPDEYAAIARQVAGLLGIDLFDDTTFEVHRLMFWPSTSKDMEYYAQRQDGVWLSADEMLDTYEDWKDASQWPVSSRRQAQIKKASEKQEDPENKKGVIGAFCRTFDIHAAVAEFLPKDYIPTPDGRYTYAKGSTAAGMVVYDDKFAFSHHGTDPSGGKLCNAFDLVRIHKFGHLDEEDRNGDISKSKSFKAMSEFARKNKKVRKTIAEETVRESKYDFAEPLEVPEESDLSWMSELEVDNRGGYLSNATNLNLIFTHDEHLKGKFKHNSFDNKRYLFDTVPWREVNKPEPVKNVDYSGVRNYIESIYAITGNLKIDDALALEFERNQYHPVREYLKSLTWDEMPRIDTLLVEYFGTPDTIYHREAMRKTMVGAVGRIFQPGIKFDLVLTLVGDEGTGKSTFAKKLGRQWFSDTFLTVQGKEALEQIQGSWIIEMAELAGLRKAEVESIKHFISKQEDIFRPAYARTAETYKRQCVFIGTTNNKGFLKDPSGNRRFIPVDVMASRATKSVFTDLQSDEVDQLWAEAVHLFESGEKLFMSKEAQKIALVEQRAHSEMDERRGLIEKYLNTKLPENWSDKSLLERQEYFSDDELIPKGKILRDAVCIAEIWCECLGKNKDDMSRYKTREINDIMKNIDGWVAGNSTKNFGVYGTQRYYERSLT